MKVEQYPEILPVSAPVKEIPNISKVDVDVDSPVVRPKISALASRKASNPGLSSFTSNRKPLEEPPILSHRGKSKDAATFKIT